MDYVPIVEWQQHTHIFIVSQSHKRIGYRHRYVQLIYCRGHDRGLRYYILVTTHNAEQIISTSISTLCSSQYVGYLLIIIIGTLLYSIELYSSMLFNLQAGIKHFFLNQKKLYNYPQQLILIRFFIIVHDNVFINGHKPQFDSSLFIVVGLYIQNVDIIQIPNYINYTLYSLCLWTRVLTR